jgi:hypothetical protein
VRICLKYSLLVFCFYSMEGGFLMEKSAIMFFIIVTLLISGGVYVNYWLYRNGAFKRPANREGW